MATPPLPDVSASCCNQLTQEMTTKRRYALYVYNTNKAAECELLTLDNGTEAGSHLRAFMRTLEHCLQSYFFVGTAVYTPAAGHVYLSSDAENWVKVVCSGEGGPLTDPIDTISGDPLYPEGRSIHLNIYNTTGGAIYTSTVSRDTSKSHAHLLRRFLKALEYCNGDHFTIQSAVYTDDDASINISAADAAWARGLDDALRGLP